MGCLPRQPDVYLVGATISAMLRYRTVAQVEADHLSLRASAERAGLALACAFSSSAEYEADLIRERRASGALRVPVHKRRAGRPRALILILSFIFLMVL